MVQKIMYTWICKYKYWDTGMRWLSRHSKKFRSFFLEFFVPSWIVDKEFEGLQNVEGEEQNECLRVCL